MIQKILIIEDERPNAERLKRLIKLIRPKAIIIEVLESIAESVSWFANNPCPDVVMLDVRLSDGLSFDLLEQSRLNCPIIFTTAYDEYAVRAFKYNSVDYLLKPVEQDELQAAFEKLESLPQPAPQQSIESLINFYRPKDYRSRFLLPFRDSYRSLLVSDIAFFYSELKITHAKLLNGKDETLPQTMEELEQQLDPKCFFRANRQFIVHMNAINQVHNYFNGKLKVDIRNNVDVEIIVSRDKAQSLKNWLDF